MALSICLMVTYRSATDRFPARSASTRRRLFGALALLTCCLSTAGAQQRKYLFEVGAAGSMNSFDKATDLGSAAGEVLRAALWLPFNFSIEGEAAFSSPKAAAANVGVKVRTIGGAGLYNLPVGGGSSAYLKAGVGTTKYDGNCPTVSRGSAICGSSGALLLGGGLRFGLTSSIMIRGEGLYNRNSSDERTGKTITVSNYGANVGVSVMLGGRPIPDSDRDGVLDNRDTCAGTPIGAQVDSRGCTADTDVDGIPNGVDRCPGTPAGATVDLTGCPNDSDHDNILDGLDQCPNTRTGVLVDPNGCPRDSDSDGIADGLDRCSATPVGATVDALGCPGDEDGDGVLDGLDVCPRSPPGAVDAVGCATGQQRNVPVPSPSPTPMPTPVPQRDSTPTPAPKPRQRAPDPTPGPSGSITETPSVLEGVMFFLATARLRQESSVVLDSIAAILLADTTLQVELGAHVDNSTTTADEARRLTNLQAEAVRTYLAQKGVPSQRMIARGYGSTMPLTSDTTPSGRLRNRRVEIRRVKSSP